MTVALISGATRGIGRHLADGFAAAGWDLGLLATNRDALLDLEADLESEYGVRTAVQDCDVTDAGQVQRAVAAVIRELGRIDVLINNAGRLDREVPLWDADPEEWWRVVEVNLRGPFLLARAVLPGMLAHGAGRIIDINSGSGTRDFATATAYTASKSALFRIGGAIHLAAFEHGVRAFELAPGVVETDMTRSMRAHERRTVWTEPADVVALALALAGGQGDHLSGCYLRVGLDDPADLGGVPRRRLGIVEG